MKAKRTNSNRSMHLEPLEGRQMMAAGDLDLSFGNGGKMLAAETVGFPVADMAVQRDGKVVLVGSLNGDFAVTRFNANGTIDRTFGGSGFLRTDFGGFGGDFANAVVIQPNGKIVVVGRRGIPIHHSDTPDFAIARYNPNGTPDNTFAGTGKRIIDFGGASGANAVALQPDGKILVAGFADTGRFSVNDDFAVARLLPNGGLDKSFDGDGTRTVDFGGDDDSALAISPGFRQKVIVGGTGGSIARFAVARFTFDGSMDKKFGDGISGDGKFSNLFLNGATFRDMDVSGEYEDEKVTIAGGINGNFMTVRLTSVGRLDRSFNGTGRIVTDFGANDEAKHVRVNGQGILVAGGSSGKFAMVRYRLNGQLDQSFGQGGKVITTVGGNDTILTTTLTSDGRIVAHGRSGSAARYFAATPIVEVLNQDTEASEAADKPGRILIKRDAAYEFSTRVFLDISGSATEGLDYTSPLLGRALAFSVPNAGGAGTLTPVQLRGLRYFIDIPAGRSSVTAQINPKADNQLEGDELVRWAPIADASYQLGAGNAGHVTIRDNTTVRVNFQVTPSPSAFAYEPDLGATFGARNNGLQFGWDVDNRANARDRGFALPGFIYNTFNHMQKSGGGSKWEIAVPNGMYEVKLAAGDPNQIDSVHSMDLENAPAVRGTPAANVRWFERTVNVLVSDGRLTLTNGAGAVNNKVAFIEIRAAAPGALAGAVTINVPVRL